MKIEQIKEIDNKDAGDAGKVSETINAMVRAINTLSVKGIDLTNNIRADVAEVVTGVGLNKSGAWEISNKYFPLSPKAVLLGQFLPQNVGANYFTSSSFTPNIWWKMGAGNSIIEVYYTSTASTTNKATITLIILY